MCTTALIYQPLLIDSFGSFSLLLCNIWSKMSRQRSASYQHSGEETYHVPFTTVLCCCTLSSAGWSVLLKSTSVVTPEKGESCPPHRWASPMDNWTSSPVSKWKPFTVIAFWIYQYRFSSSHVYLIYSLRKTKCILYNKCLLLIFIISWSYNLTIWVYTLFSK